MDSVRRRRRLPIVIMIAGLAVFFALAAGSRMLFNQAEDRLLQQRTKEAAATLQLSVTQIRASLDAVAKLAEGTNGDPDAFDRIISPSIGTQPGQFFTSAALFSIGATTPIAEVGAPLSLPVDGDNSATAVQAAATGEPLAVINLLGNDRRLGYAVADDATNPEFVVYAERVLQADPTRRRTDAPFAQLDYAIYLGTQPDSGHLIASSVPDLPLQGRTAQQAVPFGNSNLALVMRPVGHLSGDLFAHLWWIVAIGGALVSAALAILTSRLLDRHDTALELAADNERLYAEQRHIAETLQMGLLPQHLEAPEGVAVAARYWPAGSANLIGGDFYDLFAVDDGRWALAIGDVCGKGIEAAGLTGLARHTLRAAARHSTSPVEVLQSVHHALRAHRPSTFCTACFAYVSSIDNGSYRVELSLGGHPQPLLRHSTGEVELVGTLGMLLGMIEPTLSTTVVDMKPGDTLVFYTDGLTDAPAEQAVSVEELAALLELDGDQPLEALADSIRVLKRSRRPKGSGDDTALLILRFEGVSSSSAADAPPSLGEPATSGVIR